MCSTERPAGGAMERLLIACLKRWVCALVLVVISGPASAQLAQRFSTNANGDVALIGNALLTCDPGSSVCAGLQTGTASGSNSNRAMVYINIDDANLPATGVDGWTLHCNSSRATLTLPPGSDVVFAGLYWGGRAESRTGTPAQAAEAAARATVYLRLP